jgi:hypothetical protein
MTAAKIAWRIIRAVHPSLLSAAWTGAAVAIDASHSFLFFVFISLDLP